MPLIGMTHYNRMTTETSKYDDRENVTTISETPIIYLSTNDELKESVYYIRPLFGDSIHGKVSKFIKISNLKQWLSTKEGKAFQKEQLMKVLERDCPEFHATISQGLPAKRLSPSQLSNTKMPTRNLVGST